MWHHNWHGGWPHNWHGIVAAATLPPTGPATVGTFSLDLENGYEVVFAFETDIIKARSGIEQRISKLDSPKESYKGSCILFGTAPAELRATFARNAAKGLPFALGLPHEEMSFRLPSVGAVVYVHDTTKSDWMSPGQAALVKRDGVSVDVVIQSTTSNSITLDVDPGTLGLMGGVIMPRRAILLEPEQAFPRYPTEAERWEIDARATTFGFARALDTLALGPITVSAALDNVTVTARIPGTTTYFELENGGAVGAGELAEAFGVVTFRFQPGVTTLANMASALAGSAFCALTGSYNGADTIAAGDAFASTVLAGGTTSSPQGTGATLTTYLTRPVWDVDLENDGTVNDSIHAMTEIIDYGAIPYAIGTADHADWGRSMGYSGTHGPQYQWFKLFLATVKGRQKAFWLSTRRDDLPFVSKAAGTVTVDADVAAWWPAQRQHVEIKETSGTVTRAQVTAAVNNGDGTWTLTIGTTLGTSDVERVSWLELARFTSDQFVVAFTEFGHECQMVATGVQR